MKATLLAVVAGAMLWVAMPREAEARYYRYGWGGRPYYRSYYAPRNYGYSSYYRPYARPYGYGANYQPYVDGGWGAGYYGQQYYW